MGSGDGAIFPLCCKIIAKVCAAANTFDCGTVVVICPSGDEALRLPAPKKEIKRYTLLNISFPYLF